MREFKVERKKPLEIGKLYREIGTGKIGYYVRNTYKPCGNGFFTGSMYFSADPESTTGEWSVLVPEHVEEIVFTVKQIDEDKPARLTVNTKQIVHGTLTNINDEVDSYMMQTYY